MNFSLMFTSATALDRCPKKYSFLIVLLGLRALRLVVPHLATIVTFDLLAALLLLLRSHLVVVLLLERRKVL